MLEEQQPVRPLAAAAALERLALEPERLGVGELAEPVDLEPRPARRVPPAQRSNSASSSSSRMR